eukprot:1692233-Prymnesium_polylepis.1
MSSTPRPVRASPATSAAVSNRFAPFNPKSAAGCSGGSRTPSSRDNEAMARSVAASGAPPSSTVPLSAGTANRCVGSGKAKGVRGPPSFVGDTLMP